MRREANGLVTHTIPLRHVTEAFDALPVVENVVGTHLEGLVSLGAGGADSKKNQAILNEAIPSVLILSPLRLPVPPPPHTEIKDFAQAP
jgi:hypothetical protein